MTKSEQTANKTTAGTRVVNSRSSRSPQARQTARDPNLNVALARGLDVLRAFRQDDQYLSNIELARRTGIPKSSVSRLTYTLTTYGYLSYSEEIEKFSIAPGVLSLGYSVLVNNQIHVHTRPIMEKLAADNPDCAFGFGIRDGLYVTYLEYAKGRSSISLDTSAGYRVPIERSATGWAVMAGMRPKERTDLLAKLQAEHADAWPELSAKIDRALAQVWAHGYCTSMGDIDPSNNAVAIPFLHHSSKECYVINAVAPASLFTEEYMNTQAAPSLLQCAAELREKASR